MHLLTCRCLALIHQEQHPDCLTVTQTNLHKCFLSLPEIAFNEQAPNLSNLCRVQLFHLREQRPQRLRQLGMLSCSSEVPGVVLGQAQGSRGVVGSGKVEDELQSGSLRSAKVQ